MKTVVRELINERDDDVFMRFDLFNDANPSYDVIRFTLSTTWRFQEKTLNFTKDEILALRDMIDELELETPVLVKKKGKK